MSVQSHNMNNEYWICKFKKVSDSCWERLNEKFVIIIKIWNLMNELRSEEVKKYHSKYWSTVHAHLTL